MVGVGKEKIKTNHGKREKLINNTKDKRFVHAGLIQIFHPGCRF